MKTIIRSISAILLFCLPVVLLSQFEASIKYGFNSSSVITKDAFDLIDNSKGSKLGHYVEGMGDYRIDRLFSVGIGVAYKEKGFTLSEKRDISIFGIGFPVGVKAELDVRAIEIPVRLKFRIVNPFVDAYVIGGGGYSINTASSINTSATVLGDINLADFNANNLVNNNEFFGSLGFGISKNLGRGSLFTEMRYDQAFENYTSDLVLDIPIKNRGFTVGVGYSMPLN